MSVVTSARKDVVQGVGDVDNNNNVDNDNEKKFAKSNKINIQGTWCKFRVWEKCSYLIIVRSKIVLEHNVVSCECQWGFFFGKRMKHFTPIC